MLTGVTQKCWQEYVKRNSPGDLEFMLMCWQRPIHRQHFRLVHHTRWFLPRYITYSKIFLTRWVRRAHPTHAVPLVCVCACKCASESDSESVWLEYGASHTSQATHALLIPPHTLKAIDVLQCTVRLLSSCRASSASAWLNLDPHYAAAKAWMQSRHWISRSNQILSPLCRIWTAQIKSANIVEERKDARTCSAPAVQSLTY